MYSFFPKLRTGRYEFLKRGVVANVLITETVIKCICVCSQSGHIVVFDPEPVAMSTTFCTRVSFCSVSAILLFQQPCVS